MTRPPDPWSRFVVRPLDPRRDPFDPARVVRLTPRALNEIPPHGGQPPHAAGRAAGAAAPTRRAERGR